MPDGGDPVWVDIGYTDGGGVVYVAADPTVSRRRREPAGQAAADSVLERIDETVDGRCACGCGRELPADGPSGWWATESCQIRWQGAGGNSPPPMWSAPVPVDYEPRRSRSNGEQIVGALHAHFGIAERERERYQRVLNWRRWCPDCRQRSDQAEAGEGHYDDLHVTAWGQEDPSRRRPTRRPAVRQCEHCGYTWTGPDLQASVMHDFTVESGHIALRMEAVGCDGRVLCGAVTMILSTARIVATRDARDYVDRAWDYVDRAWDALERRLTGSPAYQQMHDRDERRWAAVWPAEYPFSLSLLHPDDSFGISGT